MHTMIYILHDTVDLLTYEAATVCFCMINTLQLYVCMTVAVGCTHAYVCVLLVCFAQVTAVMLTTH